MGGSSPCYAFYSLLILERSREHPSRTHGKPQCTLLQRAAAAGVLRAEHASLPAAWPCFNSLQGEEGVLGLRHSHRKSLLPLKPLLFIVCPWVIKLESFQMFYSPVAIRRGLPWELGHPPGPAGEASRAALGSSGCCLRHGEPRRALGLGGVSGAARACSGATFRGGDGRPGAEQPLCRAKGFSAG